MANRLARTGLFGEAVPLAEMAAQLQPGNPDVIHNLGWIYVNTKRPQAGMELLQKAVERQPDNATLLYRLGVALERGERPGVARGHYQQALQLDPDFEFAAEARARLNHLQPTGLRHDPPAVSKTGRR
ncbi:MAG: tetratricopeptide repeat protein [Rhodothalassiaceae bacterium]